MQAEDLDEKVAALNKPGQAPMSCLTLNILSLHTAQHRALGTK